jgi:hypothetical protein
MGGAELTRICSANYSDGYAKYTHYGKSDFRGKRIIYPVLNEDGSLSPVWYMFSMPVP